MKDMIEFSDVVANVRSELLDAHRRTQEAGEKPVMFFEECEFEFAVEAERSGEGSVKLWIVNLGGGRKRTNTNTVRIKYTRNADYKLAGD